jgi:hypothetical protein
MRFHRVAPLQMTDLDGTMSQTIVEADREQTIRAIANGGAMTADKVAAASGFTTQTQLSTLTFIKRPADCSRRRLVLGHTIGREVARGLLGRDLDLRIRRDKLVRNGMRSTISTF